MTAVGPLETFVFALAAGVLCQILSEKIRIPSIFLLLVTGIALGPDYLGIIWPQAMAEALPAIIEFGVAIILFEGGLSLNLQQIKKSTSTIRNLLTWGYALSVFLSALAARLLFQLPWALALIFGALVSITGPTVIGPIVKRLPIKEKIGALLNWESILLDAIGSIAAILILDFIIAKESFFYSTFSSGLQFLRILFTGAVFGVATGWGMAFFLNRTKMISRDGVNLFILAGALLTYVGANIITIHAGLLAVALAGITLAGRARSHLGEIREFKGILTTLLISVLFILLAARLKIQGIFMLGTPAVMLLGLIIFVIRPLNIFLSARGAGLLFREKVFLSWVAPRGIVVASFASLVALILEGHDYAGAHLLEDLTYLVIGVTVSVQGLSAGCVGRVLGVLEEKRGFLIVGAHPLCRTIGLWLQERGIEVKLVDTDEVDVRRARQLGIEAYHGNALEASTLEEYVGLQRIGTGLSLTSNDEVNTLFCQMIEKRIGKAAFQLSPRGRRVDDTDYLTKAGGKLILPGFPYLDEMTQKFVSHEAALSQVELTEAVKYECAVALPEGEFWPLCIQKGKTIEVITAGQELKKGEKVTGLITRKK